MTQRLERAALSAARQRRQVASLRLALIRDLVETQVFQPGPSDQQGQHEMTISLTVQSRLAALRSKLGPPPQQRALGTQGGAAA